MNSLSAESDAKGLQMPSPWLGAWTLCQREIKRFLRQRNRVFGALGQPIIFWLLFSEGFKPNDLDYRYFFPGTIVLILLFTAIFATISIIEDRREGFLQSVLVAPLPRWSMVLGKISGGAILAILQALAFLLLGFLTLDLGVSFPEILATILLISIIAYALTGLGFLIAWRMDSTQGFHAIMSVFLLPMWLLSGAFFPGESGWLGWIVRLNPLTYGVAGLRGALQLNISNSEAVLPAGWLCWSVTIVFATATFALSCWIAKGRTTGDLL